MFLKLSPVKPPSFLGSTKEATHLRKKSTQRPELRDGDGQGLDKVKGARGLQCKHREAKPYKQALALRALWEQCQHVYNSVASKPESWAPGLLHSRPHPEIDKFLAVLFKLLDLFGINPVPWNFQPCEPIIILFT